LNQEVTIRKALKSDLLSISTIEKNSFGEDAFSIRQFKYLLESSNAYFYVAAFNTKPVGYLILLKRKKCKNLRIYSIAIDSSQRGKGIAYEFIDFAKQIAINGNFSRLTLEVSENNQPAIKLYQKANFIVMGIKPKYYHDGSGALVMWLDL